jgi:hypothetical protein
VTGKVKIKMEKRLFCSMSLFIEATVECGFECCFFIRGLFVLNIVMGIGKRKQI